MKPSDLKLILVTQSLRQPLVDYLDFIDACVAAGVTCVQLREKELSGDELLDYAGQLQTHLKQTNTPLIINDDVLLCQAIDAAGVHLGQSDQDAIEARACLGREKIIGLSVNSMQEIRQANALPIDYIGVGSVFETSSKLDVATIWGVDKLAQAVALSTHPVVAIGGINVDNAGSVLQTGVKGIAAIAAFHQADELNNVVQQLKYPLSNSLQALQKRNPLILNLTNVVTMDLIANVLLAIGASPLMTVCDEELEELITLSAAVVVNIGTLDSVSINRSFLAAKLAKKRGIPVILDPAGAGATIARTQAAKKILPYATVVKGNASEIMAIAGKGQLTKGVDSVHSTNEAITAAKRIANNWGCVVVVSGAVDCMTDGRRTAENNGGSVLMTRITGAGCALAAVIAAFLAVEKESFVVAVKALGFYSSCAEQAAEKANFPGSFRSKFIDQLYQQSRREV